jgi:hypothetical protein
MIGVMPSVSHESVYSVDFAPAFAGLGNIRFPNDLGGRRLY